MTHANRRLVGIAAGALIFCFSFGWSFLAAFHAPAPHQVPLGVVAPAAEAHQLSAMLDAHVPGGLSLHTYASVAAAREAVVQRAVDGAFIAGAHPVLLVASAGGSATAQFLETTFGSVASAAGLPLRVSDVVPLPASNSAGLALFFLMLSVLIPSIAVGLVSTLAARNSDARPQAGVLTVGAIAIGAVAAWIVDGITGAVPGHYLALAGICALLSLAVSASSAALARITPPAAALALLSFVVVGIPATGGPAGMAQFMPAFFRDVAPGLPASRALPALTNAAYFGGSETALDLWVLAIWIVAALVVLVLAGSRHRIASEAGQLRHEAAEARPAPSSPA
jgi:hypothetical protein